MNAPARGWFRPVRGLPNRRADCREIPQMPMEMPGGGLLDPPKGMARRLQSEGLPVPPLPAGGGASTMSTFDNPFDPHNPLRRGCVCGRHINQLEHDRAEVPVM